MKKTTFLLPVLAGVIAAPALASGVPVTATSVVEGVYQPTLVLTSKLEAQEHARLTPRVTGYLIEQHFPDGAFVKQGDVLFQIDDTSYKLALQSALAQKQQAQAALQQAKLNHQRISDLIASGGTTKANLDDASASLLIAEAGLALATASVDKAQDDLSHTQIRAPYDGQLGKSQFSRGDMVSPNSGAVIDIAQLHPLNASFSLSYDDYNQFPIDKSNAVNVALKPNLLEGQVTFVDNKVHASTGTLSAAAEFANQDYALRPNQIMKLKLTSKESMTGAWLPQTAVMQDLMMQFIYIVNEEGLAERREVSVVARQGKQVFIEQGVEAGEVVITDGLVRVRPNVPVSIQE
ncbi:efflux RND transporter periplasmic adaptor subunit [Vibrio sp. WXL210]|uniref:efflux RND transporter periplasmic adaptor subunit n=1 Tax=Vibrio sp. WXL210 TaxID=3450709 RepID=UPI003EC6AC91